VILHYENPKRRHASIIVDARDSCRSPKL